MNERIKKLLVQAHLEASDLKDTNWIAGRFAELIVGECADIALEHTPDTEECNYTWLIHDKIKEHFGVEE